MLCQSLAQDSRAPAVSTPVPWTTHSRSWEPPREKRDGASGDSTWRARDYPEREGERPAESRLLLHLPSNGSLPEPSAPAQRPLSLYPECHPPRYSLHTSAQALSLQKPPPTLSGLVRSHPLGLASWHFSQCLPTTVGQNRDSVVFVTPWPGPGSVCWTKLLQVAAESGASPSNRTSCRDGHAPDPCCPDSDHSARVVREHLKWAGAIEKLKF